MTNLKRNNYIHHLLLLFLLIAMIAGCTSQVIEDKNLPIYGHKDLRDRLVNGKNVVDTVYHTVPDFVFTDQDSSKVTNATFKDRIYIADFFFTSCPDICPAMTTQMLRVYEQFKTNDQIAFLSHTIDPKRDSVHVLKDYADRIGVDVSDKWYFVTGEKDKIYDIGMNGYMVTADEDSDAPGGFIHSGAFILVDKDQRIRGIYDGTKESKVDKLMLDIPKLLTEYQSK